MTSKSILVTTLALLFAVPAHADGLLASLPEPGQFVVYELVAVPIQEDDESAVAEMQGSLRVACVGIEQDQAATSRWIESEVTLTGGGQPDIHFVFKLLVPDAGVDDTEALLPITRGWFRPAEGQDITEISPDRIALYHPSFLFMRTVLASPNTTEALTSEKSIEIDGEALTLSTATSGQFEPLSQQVEQTATMILTGEGTWWADDDLAFVGSAEIFWTLTLGEADAPPEDRATKGIALQLNAIETGDDAVSLLPDSN